MDDDDKIIFLPRQYPAEEASGSIEDRILATVKSVAQQPKTIINRPAIGTFLTIAFVGLIGAALVPSSPDGGLSWSAAMGLLYAVLGTGLAALYRYERSYWIRPTGRLSGKPLA